jgi:glutamyl-tRNA reductase
MTARLACLGVSGCGPGPHPAASIDLRERCRRTLAERPLQLPGLAEHAILSTCHRVELYAFFEEDAASSLSRLLQWLAESIDIDPDQLAPHVSQQSGMTVARHLSRVAAGLESVVLGEPEILGQVSAARAAADQNQTGGPILSAVFHTAIRAGRRARTETAISTNPTSLSSLALSLAESILGDLRERPILIVGLGEIGRNSLKELKNRGASRLALANRTQATAESLAAQSGAKVFGFGELPAAVASADVVLCATSAPNPILTAPMLKAALRNRIGNRVVILDLAMPRNAEPGIESLDGIRLFDVDDLQSRLDASLALRRAEAPKVEAIVEEELLALDRELRQRTVIPLIADLRQKAERIRQRELERTLGFLRAADPQVIEHVQHLSHSLVNGLLHGPTARLKEMATDGNPADHAAAVRDLFGLES